MVIEFEKVHNARDLGGLVSEDGKSIKKGLLFRSAALWDASDADLEKIEDLGINLIIDLRLPRDIKAQPDRLPKGCDYLNLPMADFQYDIRTLRGGFKAEPYMSQMYREFVQKDMSCECLSRFIDVISSHEGAVLWHCKTGKDRAGVASIVLEAALGINIKDIRSDYLLSSRFADKRPHMSKRNAALTKVLIPKTEREKLYTVKEKYFNAFIDEATSLYGSLDGFLEKGLGVTNGKRKKLRDRFLEE